jgi:hypothetical protein
MWMHGCMHAPTRAHARAHGCVRVDGMCTHSCRTHAHARAVGKQVLAGSECHPRLSGGEIPCRVAYPAKFNGLRNFCTTPCRAQCWVYQRGALLVRGGGRNYRPQSGPSTLGHGGRSGAWSRAAHAEFGVRCVPSGRPSADSQQRHPLRGHEHSMYNSATLRIAMQCSTTHGAFARMSTSSAPPNWWILI